MLNLFIEDLTRAICGKRIIAHHPTPHPQKLNVSNISAVTDPILMKLKM